MSDEHYYIEEGDTPSGTVWFICSNDEEYPLLICPTENIASNTCRIISDAYEAGKREGELRK